MTTPPAAAQIKIYVDRLLAILERIAVCLENGSLKVDAAASLPPEVVKAPDVHNNAAPVSPVETAVTYDQVRGAVLSFQDVKGVKAAQDVLKAFGARYIMDLKARPESFAEVLKALQ